PPGLPSAPLTGAQFAQFVTDPNGPIQGRPFDPPTLSVIGDIELGAALLWLDRFPRSTSGSGIRSVAQGLVRLPTGQLDRSDRFFDVGTGNGHVDVDLSLATDLALGRLGARLTGAYTLQFPGSLTRRVAPPEQPIAPASRTAEVRRDPGEIWRVSAQPFFRLGSSLSLFAGGERSEERRVGEG